MSSKAVLAMVKAYTVCVLITAYLVVMAVVLTVLSAIPSEEIADAYTAAEDAINRTHKDNPSVLYAAIGLVVALFVTSVSSF